MYPPLFSPKLNPAINVFDKLDFNKANWANLISAIKQIDWSTMLDPTSSTTCLIPFTDIIILLFRAFLNILVRNASPRGPMCFRCLIFNLWGPCEFLFCSLLDLRSSEYDVVSLCVCLFCVLVNCVTIRNVFGCSCYFVVNSLSTK